MTYYDYDLQAADYYTPYYGDKKSTKHAVVIIKNVLGWMFLSECFGIHTFFWHDLILISVEILGLAWDLLKARPHRVRMIVEVAGEI